MSIEEFDKLDAKENALYLIEEFDDVGPCSELLDSISRSELQDLCKAFEKMSITVKYMKQLLHLYIKD